MISPELFFSLFLSLKRSAVDTTYSIQDQENKFLVARAVQAGWKFRQLLFSRHNSFFVLNLLVHTRKSSRLDQGLDWLGNWEKAKEDMDRREPLENEINTSFTKLKKTNVGIFLWLPSIGDWLILFNLNLVYRIRISSRSRIFSPVQQSNGAVLPFLKFKTLPTF